MCPIAKGPHHGPAPIPEEGRWVKAYQISDISGLSHGIGWCAPQQGCCKLTLNVKDGIIQEALVETLGCSGMTHSAAMAGEILPGKTLLEALNTDLVCDAINVAMRERLLSRRMVCQSAPAWRTLAKVCAPRWEPSSPPVPKAFAIWSWQKDTSFRLLWMRTTKQSDINLSA